MSPSPDATPIGSPRSIAAVGGLSLAALRRWGPLKPEQQEPKQEPKKGA